MATFLFFIISGIPYSPDIIGLEIQSNKFFKIPGIEPLYSGVTIQTKSEFFISCLTSETD